MISLFSGTPGSGKSLNAAREIRVFLRDCGDVIGTFPINEKCLFKHTKYQYHYIDIFNLDPKQLIEFALSHERKKPNPEGSFLLVIDEAQRKFNSREWNTKDRGAWITFFAEHRHLGFDIILISQNDRMLDRQIRCLIEYNFVHRKYSQFGIAGRIFSVFTGQYVVIKTWVPLKEKISSYFFRGNKQLYNFYDSFQLFDKVEEGDKGTPDDALSEAESPT